MNHFNIALTCATGADVTLEQATELTLRLLEIGQADARQTLKSGEGCLEDAEQAAALSYQVMQAKRAPRVLVAVENGCAEVESDPGVDIEVLDLDGDETPTVSEAFADLAYALKVPVQEINPSEPKTGLSPGERQATQLRAYIQALVDSASQDGCSEDLTVVSDQALRDLVQFVKSMTA